MPRFFMRDPGITSNLTAQAFIACQNIEQQVSGKERVLALQLHAKRSRNRCSSQPPFCALVSLANSTEALS